MKDYFISLLDRSQIESELVSHFIDFNVISFSDDHLHYAFSVDNKMHNLFVSANSDCYTLHVQIGTTIIFRMRFKIMTRVREFISYAIEVVYSNI